MNDQVHVIVRFSPDGSVYATSPQAPGLLYGRSSIEELRVGLDNVLSFHFDQNDTFDVIEHHEHSYEVAGRELVIRVAFDSFYAERASVSDRILQVTSEPEQASSVVSAVTNSVGEAVYVCAVPSDTFGWLRGQLGQHGDAFVAALTIADNFLFALPLAVDDEPRPAWRPASFEAGTRLSEIMQRTPIVTASEMVILSTH
jgi:hypothetical protein